MGVFRQLCAKDKMTELAWPARPYVVQVARFDPAKGIPHLIASYVKFRQTMDAQPKGRFGPEETPQLLICGHGAVDDPDATIIYDQVRCLSRRVGVIALEVNNVVRRSWASSRTRTPRLTLTTSLYRGSHLATSFLMLSCPTHASHFSCRVAKASRSKSAR